MKEEVITIGQESIMIGILTESSKNLPEKPMVLLLNAGLVHRVGPYREWVDLARQFSQDGFSSYRFDLTGLGDSEIRKDRMNDEARAISDIRNTMDYFEKTRGIKRFILLGLCSGADNGHPLSVEDARVVGTIFIDGIGYRTTRWYFHHYFSRFINLQGWKNKSKLLFNIITCPFTGKTKTTVKKNKQFIREFPPQKQTEAELIELINRGVNMLYIYTSGVSRYLNYHSQFNAMYPKIKKSNQLEVMFYKESDHTFTLMKHRLALFQLIHTWMQRF
jgi:hypothetical protein